MKPCRPTKSKLTQEQRERIDKVRAELDKQLAPQLKALEDSTRITAKDLMIIILPPREW